VILVIIMAVSIVWTIIVIVQAIVIVASAWLFWVGSYNNKWVSNWLKVRVVL